MNSKERVKSVLARRQPDRIPAGEFAIDFDTVERLLGHETFLRAKAKSQIALWEGRRDEVVMSWKEDSVELYRKLDVYDIVNVNAMAFGQLPPRGYDPEAPELIAPGTWKDRQGRIFKLSEATKDISLVADPLEWEREFSASDYPAEGPVEAPDPSAFEVVDHLIRELGAERYILWGAGDESELPFLKGSSSPLSERSLCQLALDPELCDAVAAYQFRRARERDGYCIRPGQDGVMWAQDFACKTGPIISPEMFRRYVTRYAKERVRALREERGLPVFKHACGNNWALLDQFAEIGYACYQSIQPTASMDLGEVAGRYGGAFCLWGGLPVEDLVGGSMDEVRRDVRRAVEAGKRAPAYIFGSSHSVAVGTKYDNFMAMLDEFVKLRDY